MLKFDKLKLVTKIDYISDIDYSKFILNSKEDSILYYKYQQERPFYLLVMVNYQHNELVLEFTGKILLDNYTNLIHLYTAKDCLSQINRLGICHLNVESIMTDSNVVKCDITKDIECGSMQDIITNVRQNLSNYKKWVTLLKECGYDMSAVEAKVRALSAKTTSITRVMKVYKDLYSQMQMKTVPQIDIRALVA